MEHPEPQEVAIALRAQIRATDGGIEPPLDPSLTLTRSIEKMLFQRGDLGPVDAILQRSSEILGACDDWSSLPTDQLLSLWKSTIQKLMLDFSRSPESWTDDGSKEFFERSAVVFGVDDGVIQELLRNFHQSPKEARVAIFLPIRHSSLFGYIAREINEMVDDVEIADPTESLRSLIRSVVPTT